MTASFGSAALGLFGIAARLLGWRPADFWTATPAELVAALSPRSDHGQSFDRVELEKLMERDNG
jgi:Phage tail assembly chaperone protein, TAC